MIHTDYHSKLLEPKIRTEIVNELCLAALRFKGEFGIICTGASGMIGAMVADRLHKPIMLIRKDGDNCHSSYHVEFDSSVTRWIFIDDMVEQGSTMRRVLGKLKEYNAGECLAAIMYTGLSPFKDLDGTPIILLDVEEIDI